jgi:class 3 adenylate cyclase
VDPLNVKRRLTCILAADAVGYSQQMGQDEEGTIRVLSSHRAIIDGIITFHGGRIVSTAGDSVLAEFSSVVEAVRCAVEVQEALKTRNDTLPESRRMLFRVGVNLGDVVVKDNDLLGDGVNVAARLETLAEPGGICISSSVYDQITGKLDLGFKDIGEQALKNISRPIRVYRVSGTGVPQAPPAPPQRAPAPKSFPWGIVATAVVALAGIGAWQTGWMRFGASDRPSQKAAVAPVADPPRSVPAPPAGVAPAIDAITQGVRESTDAIRKQVEAEVSRALTDADATRTAKSNAAAEAAASRVRARAEVDAARIRKDAEEAAARTKAEPAAADKVAKASVAPAPAPAVAAAQGARFDGSWKVALSCAGQADGSAPYQFEFDAQVKDGFLRGTRGEEGKGGSLRLQGPIAPDGEATLEASGLTGDPKYGGRVQGAPYFYHVAAHFDPTRGSGKRVEIRACDLYFAKQ